MNSYVDIDRLTPDWEGITHIILYGTGMIEKTCIGKISSDFTVDYFIDKNYVDKSVDGFEVLSPDEGLSRMTDQKIIVMTAGRAYHEIADYLEGQELEEYRDFCSIEDFLSEWYWKYQNLNCVMEVHTAVTTACTLRCRNCNMFIPYYKSKTEFTVEDADRDLALLFRSADFVFSYVILGGEPFLAKDIGKIIEMIGKKYRDKIGSLKIITNGTVVPDDYTMQQLKDNQVWISISDYTSQVPYEKKINEFISKLNEYGIYYTVNKSLRWNEFGFPSAPLSIPESEAAKHMISCSPVFHGVNEGKYYYCHVAWSAEKSGLFQLSDDDYIDLTKVDPHKPEDRRRIVLHSLGMMDKGYVSLCRYCGGCGSDNTNYVTAGVQVKKLESIDNYEEIF